MARTESKSMQVHPRDEQKLIELMQKFHWSLLGSQEVNTKDSHLEVERDWTGEGRLMSITETERYIKLQFSRDLSLPNLQEIKQIEEKYFSLPIPKYPELFPISIWMWIIGAFFWGIGIIGWLIYFFVSYKHKQEIANKTNADLVHNRTQLLKDVEQYN